jgi:hypothetical protein
LNGVRANFQKHEQKKRGRLKRGYNGYFDTLLKISVEEGVPSLYRGVGPVLLKPIPTQIIDFMLSDSIKSVFAFTPQREGCWRCFLGDVSSVAVTAVVTLAVTYPLEYCAFRLAMDTKVKKCRREHANV